MASYAYSKLFVGIVLRVRLEDYEAAFKRFDPKTGQPVELKSKAFSATVVAPDGEVLHTLPPDTDAYAESGKTFYDDWKRDRLEQRLSDWLESIGIKNVEHGVRFGYFFDYFFDYGQYCDKPAVVIGIQVGSGSSSDSERACISIPFERTSQAKEECTGKIFEAFVTHPKLAESISLQLVTR
jgi:hypothetical protein